MAGDSETGERKGGSCRTSWKTGKLINGKMKKEGKVARQVRRKIKDGYEKKDERQVGRRWRTGNITTIMPSLHQTHRTQTHLLSN